MADLNLTIANHKDIPTEIVVTLNSYYGSNVVIRWDNKDTPLQKINANKYQFGKLFKANEVVTWLWN